MPLDLEPGDDGNSDGCKNGAGLTVNCGRTSALDADRRRSETPAGLRVEGEGESLGAIDPALLCVLCNSPDSGEKDFPCFAGNGDGDRTTIPGAKFSFGWSTGGDTNGVVCLDLSGGSRCLSLGSMLCGPVPGSAPNVDECEDKGEEGLEAGEFLLRLITGLALCPLGGVLGGEA